MWQIQVFQTLILAWKLNFFKSLATNTVVFLETIVYLYWSSRKISAIYSSLYTTACHSFFNVIFLYRLYFLKQFYVHSKTDKDRYTHTQGPFLHNQYQSGTFVFLGTCVLWYIFKNQCTNTNASLSPKVRNLHEGSLLLLYIYGFDKCIQIDFFYLITRI